MKLTNFVKWLPAVMLFAGVSCSTDNGWESFSGDKRIEERVDSVLSLMTLEEKIGQMTQFASSWDTGPRMNDDFRPYLEKGLVGSIFGASTVNGIRNLQELALKESRLKIPVLFGFDVIHGYRTIFPMSLAEAGSWDLEMIEKASSISSQEAASEGINWTFAPMVDIARDARWGRIMEGAGEDPYLGSRIAEARVRGIQGKDLQDVTTLLACVKHFAAYGAAEAGRDYNTAELSERTLRDFYLPPYKAALDAGAATVMAAFNEINGVPCTANKWLMTDLLRDDWGFKGFVVTDYTGTNELVPHSIAADEKEAGELAVNAGIDMDMTGAVFIKNMQKSVAEGKVSEAQIDQAVRRILEMKFLLGLFDDPYRYLDETREKETIRRPDFMQAAREAVAKCAVLLKNDNNILPISKEKPLTVALVGPFVKERISLNGEWAGLGDRNQSVTLWEGLNAKYADSRVKFIYAEGSDLHGEDCSKINEAVAAARRADIVVAALGEDFNWSGEAACRTDIKLPESQREMLKALKKTGKPIAAILINGRPLDLSWESENLDAILEAWYPGTQAGNGLADVIAGDYNPSARLTVSFPRNIGQLPIYYNHKNTGRPLSPLRPKEDYKSRYLDVPNTPLYPFGYGLSYTTYAVSDLKLDKAEFTQEGEINVTAQVANTGKMDGQCVVQMYVRDLAASVTRPVKELKGFEKVALKAGETKTVSFTIKAEDLAFHNINMDYVAEPGNFKVWVGLNSADESNEAAFALK